MDWQISHASSILRPEKVPRKYFLHRHANNDQSNESDALGGGGGAIENTTAMEWMSYSLPLIIRNALAHVRQTKYHWKERVSVILQQNSQSRGVEKNEQRTRISDGNIYEDNPIQLHRGLWLKVNHHRTIVSSTGKNRMNKGFTGCES